MRNSGLSSTSTLRTIFFVSLITLVVAVIPARAQNAVPATARQAAAMPEFARRLKPSTTAQAGHKSPVAARGRFRRGSPLDQAVYENGPVNGEVDAWTIYFNFTVSDSLQTTSPVTGIQFWAWLVPGDTISNVEVQIGANAFGNELFDGVVTLTQSNCWTNVFGYNICMESGNFNGPTPNGNAWVTLGNANVPSGDPVYWDENSGVGCTSPGCPSQAQENTIGTLPSEAFTLLGGTTTTTTVYTCYGSDDMTSIHDFSGGEDGDTPNGVALDKGENLYGTTNWGGSAGLGMAFKLTQEGSGWLLDNLYNFLGGSLGGYPSPPMIGPNGNVYGTANGGLQNCPNGTYCGQVFSLTPSPTACVTAMCGWNQNILYQFTGGADSPGAISAFDQEGNLYGTEVNGGALGLGTVFKLTPTLGGWTKTVLYTFTGTSDGKNPGPVLLSEDGNLYGYANGGVYNSGVVYQLGWSGNGWTQNIIYAFQQPNYGNYTGLAQDGSGNLYGGSTAYRRDEWGFYIDALVYELSKVNGTWTYGEVYRISPSTWNSYVYIYNLASNAAGDVWGAAQAYCTDCYPDSFLFNEIFETSGGYDYVDGGSYGYGQMAVDGRGGLYGVSGCGGRYRKGWVWRIGP